MGVGVFYDRGFESLVYVVCYSYVDVDVDFRVSTYTPHILSFSTGHCVLSIVGSIVVIRSRDIGHITQGQADALQEQMIHIHKQNSTFIRIQ